MDFKKIIFALLGSTAFVVLAQNTQVISLRFLFWELRMSRIILFLIVLVVGFAFGFVAGRKTRG